MISVKIQALKSVNKYKKSVLNTAQFSDVRIKDFKNKV